MKRLFLLFLIFTISIVSQAQLKKVKVGNETIFLPDLKGYTECAKSKFSKPYIDVLLPQKMSVLGLYIKDMALKNPEFNFFYQGTNDCLLFMVSDILENQELDSFVFEEFLIQTMDTIYGEKDPQLLERLKKEIADKKEFIPQPLSLINSYSIEPNSKTYVFIEPSSYNEIRCTYKNYTLINNRVVEFTYCLTLNDESFLELSENNNNYFLKSILLANDIKLRNEHKETKLIDYNNKSNDSFYTKDGYNMGSRKAFIRKVTRNVDDLDFSGLKINAIKVWACITNNKIPTLSSEELHKIVNKDIARLFPTDEKEIDELMNCIGDGFSIGESYLDLCKERYLKAGFSEQESKSYCECEYGKLKEIVVDYKAFKKYYSEIGDEHKDSYNEVILPCRNLFEKDKSKNSYVSGDIEGFSDESIVKLTPSGTTFKIKLVINGVSRYFIFDSGASELVINSDLEKELLDKKIIVKSDYVNSKSFAIADGSIVNAKGVILNNVVIGGFKVHNVTAYITDKGGMLCGMGLLNKFKNWEFDKDQSMLTIYK